MPRIHVSGFFEISGFSEIPLGIRRYGVYIDLPPEFLIFRQNFVFFATVSAGNETPPLGVSQFVIFRRDTPRGGVNPPC
jgi:hypothetical protein